ncbi:MAG: hypothetical protein IAE78_28480 [Myxococcus sp.]|nr:hypothetical protein [Myxococcus sp.]
MRVDNRSTVPSNPRPVGYTEPPAGAALARGHSGAQVLELQKKLNAAGLQPPLKLDGQLGPKTEAALLKLTGAKTFDDAAQAALASRLAPKSDGFDASLPKPSIPQPPMAEGVAMGTQAPASGSIAEKTLAIAQQELGSVDPRKAGADGKYQGWDKLQTIFEKTTGWRPSDKEVQGSSQPGGKSWCGIFACHVLQEAGANVKWDLTKGKMVGDVQQVMAPSFKDHRTYKTERSAFEASIKPGDVITLNGKNNHHAIVSSVNPDGTVNTIDGNKPHIGEGHFKLADVTSYYRPTGASASSAAQVEPKPVSAGPSVEGGDSGKAAAGSLGERFHVEAPSPAKKEQLEKVVDLSGDKASRLKALNGFTQVDDKVDTESDLNACAAASIVAGAAIEGGSGGLNDLVRVIEERGNATRVKKVTGGWKDAEIPEYGKLDGIKERINAGKATSQDLHDLKTIVYKQLRKVEDQVGANSKDATINIDAVKAYVNTDVKVFGEDRPLKAMFGNMNIKLVDTDGDDKGNHFVLMFNDGTGKGENAVYDPWPTKSGNQINQNQAELLAYHHNVRNALR